MSEITLEVVSIDSAPVPDRRCCFSGVGGTIGRDEGNTLVLQDKHRRVSRLHASVTFPDGVPTIANASTTLPISVGSTLLNHGEKIRLSAGDLIEIGPFVLRARANETSNTEDTLIAHVQPTVQVEPIKLADYVVPGFATGPLDPLASLMAGSSVGSATDPFADLFADLAPVKLAPEVSTPPAPPAPMLPRASAPVAVAKPVSAVLPAVSPAAQNSADPLSQMLGAGTAQADVAIGGGDLSIDALFASPASASYAGLTGDSCAGMYSTPSLNGLTASAESSDPLMMFGAAAGDPGASMYAPVRDDLPEIGGAYQPPRAFFPDAHPTYGAPSQAAFFAGANQGEPQANVNGDALTSAFLNAVGLPPGALPGGLTPELMTVIGGLLRTATAGAIDMLAARAATKLELQASVTIISSQSNNPLKFLPNAESALQQMLGKKMPGFMRADQAMRDAFDDLRAHEIGVIAGTRAALTEVLGRFDPSALEKRLAGGSLLDSLLPSIRKTKLWEIYLEQYAKIRREAEDDFQSVFGRSFLQAYEQETNRVKSHTSHSGSI